MKRCAVIKVVISILVILGLVGSTGAAFATSPAEDESANSSVAPTFSSDFGADGTLSLSFGSNALLLGNAINSETVAPGLLFLLGNDVRLASRSEYAFILGNNVNVESTATKDLFLAGNLITLSPSAQIGRDVFAVAYGLAIEADLPGSLSANANRVVFRNATVAGNVNLDVESVVFEGQNEIKGSLTINDNAVIEGSENVNYGSFETYQHQTQNDAAILWTQKLISMFSLALAAIIVILAWPRARFELTSDTNLRQFGNDLVVGLATLILIPVLAFLCLLSYFAAPLGIIIALLYIIVIYLSQAFAGVWLGRVLVARFFRSSAPVYIEAIIGVLILGCLSMVPGIGFLTGCLGLILGIGLMVRACRKTCTAPETTARQSKKKVT